MEERDKINEIIDRMTYRDLVFRTKEIESESRVSGKVQKENNKSHCQSRMCALLRRKWMVERKVIVKHSDGVHLRVAAELVKICREQTAIISISREGCSKADACSVLGVLMLSARKGTELTITAEGGNASSAVEKIANYFESGGGI